MNIKDISVEVYREYEFGGTKLGEFPKVYRINDPVSLIIGTSTHRVVDTHGIVHCVPAPGYNNCVLRWEAKDKNVPVIF